MRAVMACVVTHLAASVGGITWVLLDYRLDKKWSTVGFCSGAVAGMELFVLPLFLSRSIRKFPHLFSLSQPF
jgi:hypothetical protein